MMNDEHQRDAGHHSSFITHHSLGLVALILFFAARVTILLSRDPFFDELFTVWMARQPFSKIVPHLLSDSGPPLYYFLARIDSVLVLRIVSLVFATVQLVLVLRRSALAALLLAVYPPAVLFAVDARSYALCALFVTAAVLSWEKGRSFVAALLLVAAAYSHYYGVLFFPLLLVRGGQAILPAREAGQARLPVLHLKPFALALLLFIPGFLLAFNQPPQAFAWVRETPLPAFFNLSTAGVYPEALFAPAPVWVVGVGMALVLALAFPLNPYAAWVIGPLALISLFHLAGRPVYFPMRFESVIAGPLVLWLTASQERWRKYVCAGLVIIGLAVIYQGVLDYLRRPVDPYREAALMLLRNASPEDTVVATGYTYLETAVALRRPVLSFPADQAAHPGWRSAGPADPRQLPRHSFIWIAERSAPELSTVGGVRRLQPLFANERAIVHRVGAQEPGKP